MYILIHRKQDGPKYAEYIFGESEESVGRLRLDKETGGVTLIEAAPDDTNLGMFQRAERKLTQHWKAGVIPEKTCWAT